MSDDYVARMLIRGNQVGFGTGPDPTNFTNATGYSEGYGYPILPRKQRGGGRRPVRQRGGGLKDVLKKAHDFVKSKKLVSSGLRHFGYNNLAKHAALAGYGKRKRRTVKRRQRGGNIFGDIWGGIKKVGGFLKDNKLISKGLSLIPDARAKTAAGIAGQLGLGRRRRVQRRRTQRGRGLKDVLKKAHDFVKSKKLVSSGLRHFGYNNLAKHAALAGYGKRRGQRGGSLAAIYPKGRAKRTIFV